MDLGLADETALVTASTSGLGLASAAALADAGANVTVCGRDPDRLADAEAHLADREGQVLARQADITNPDDVEDLVTTTVDAFGGLDHLVTSAGGVPSGPLLETSEREWYTAYDTLVMSAVWTLERAHPHLAAGDGTGTWVAITSTSVREAIDGLVLSNAVRRAVIGLVKTAAREFAPEVRANAVLPGPHETPRIEELVEQSMERGEYDDYDEGLADWASDVPQGRVGDPRELGDIVAVLSSERASFVNGTALPVDGGRLRS